ncbi:hypothetical protein V1515DRAFT_583210, partial [Lipomyces mesembrius]
MSQEKGLQILIDAAEYHADDLNFPEDAMMHIQNLIANTTSEGDSESYDIADDDSIPVETIRAYFELGIVWVVIDCFVNSFFSWRQPSLSLKSTAIQLLLYPCGKAVKLLPDWGFTVRGKR